MSESQNNSMTGEKAARGEPFVWLTAMGLALGLLMIVYLLGLIVYNGVTVFWPKQVVELTVMGDGHIKKDTPPATTESKVIGEITRKQQRQGATDGSREWQLYTANRDAFGYSFRFVDEEAIKGESLPEGIIKIERMEYGSVLGYPLRVVRKTGDPVDVSTAEGLQELRRIVDDVIETREEIKHLEKTLIGAINHEMDMLNRRKRGIIRESGESNPQIAEMDEQIKVLDSDYQELAAQARALRDSLKENKLAYRISSGEEREMETGMIVDFYTPNTLTAGQKIGRFFHNAKVFLLDNPREANTEGGVFPAIFGTVVMTILMSIVVTPFGVLAAVYMHEYAKTGPMLTTVRVAVNNLAGVPSIVFGVFGLGFFIYFCGAHVDEWFFKDSLPTPTFGTGGLLWASLTLALLTVPVVIVATEEALAAVPRGAREASLACGASKWQTIQRVVLPASAPGILTGMILAMARGAGEVAPLMLVGVVKLAPTLPLNATYPYAHFDQKFMHLGFHIFDLGFQSPDSEAALPMVYSTTLLLIVVVVVLNLAGILVREHLRRKYAGGTF